MRLNLSSMQSLRGLYRAARVRWHHAARRVTGYILIAPATIFLVAFAAYPILHTLRLSVSRFTPGEATMPFIGLQNFIEILKDPDFATTLKNTVVFSVGCLVVSLGLGLVLALLLNQRWFSLKVRNTVRGLFILPWLYSSAAAAVTWALLYHPRGMIDYVLARIGLIDKPITFLADPKWAMLSVIIILSWKAYPFLMVMILGALQSISEELYDAAAVDGASGSQVFRYVTLPLIRPVLLTISTLMFIWSFGHFDLIKIVTRGGPGLSTQTLPYYVYRAAFFKLGFDYGAAVSIIIFLILAGLSLVYVWLYTRGGLAYGETEI